MGGRQAQSKEGGYSKMPPSPSSRAPQRRAYVAKGQRQISAGGLASTMRHPHRCKRWRQSQQSPERRAAGSARSCAQCQGGQQGTPATKARRQRRGLRAHWSEEPPAGGWATAAAPGAAAATPSAPGRETHAHTFAQTAVVPSRCHSVSQIESNLHTCPASPERNKANWPRTHQSQTEQGGRRAWPEVQSTSKRLKQAAPVHAAELQKDKTGYRVPLGDALSRDTTQAPRSTVRAEADVPSEETACP